MDSLTQARDDQVRRVGPVSLTDRDGLGRRDRAGRVGLGGLTQGDHPGRGGRLSGIGLAGLVDGDVDRATCRLDSNRPAHPLLSGRGEDPGVLAGRVERSFSGVGRAVEGGAGGLGLQVGVAGGCRGGDYRGITGAGGHPQVVFRSRGRSVVRRVAVCRTPVAGRPGDHAGAATDPQRDVGALHGRAGRDSRCTVLGATVEQPIEHHPRGDGRVACLAEFRPSGGGAQGGNNVRREEPHDQVAAGRTRRQRNRMTGATGRVDTRRASLDNGGRHGSRSRRYQAARKNPAAAITAVRSLPSVVAVKSW